MSRDFQFETLVDVHSNIFQEYLSSVIAKLPREDEGYRAIRDQITQIYEQYPNVMGVFDVEQTAALTEQECTALIKVLELRNQLLELEFQSVYFRGCYDSVGYLKKAGIL